MMRRTLTFIVFITQFLTIYSSVSPNIQSNAQEQMMSFGEQENPKMRQCEGNRFKYISKHSFDKQNDLLLTFREMQGKTEVQKVIYRDELFRTYTIFPLNMTLSYSNLKQIATPISDNEIQVSGGTLRISYNFKWQKKQLSSSIQGTGKGVVNTDPISFIKSLNITEQKKFQWNFISAQKITITNSLTLQQISPYKVADYIVINQMLNELKTGQDTVKIKLVKALNTNFTKILKIVVHQNNDTYNQPLILPYTYIDYHGRFDIKYQNTVVDFSLKSGLELLLSTLIDDDKFDCGEKLPMVPQDEQKYGGIQQFISTSFIKSTLRNAINEKFLNVQLTEQFWQSPAFQFFMGDTHEIMPSTINISTLVPITGICRALDDKNFELKAKTINSYSVITNFTCDFRINNQTKLIGINLVIEYQISLMLQSRFADFYVKSIVGTPTFFQQDEYKIKNYQLTTFMIDQTLRMAIGSKVVGSGFRILDRKYPNFIVREKYLFLYDAGAKQAKKKVIEKVEEEQIL